MISSRSRQFLDHQARRTLTSVLIPVTAVRGVPVPVVDVVDVVTVRHGHMAAALSVLVGVAVVLRVAAGLTRFRVSFARPVQMAVVCVVDVIAVRHRDMAASRPV
jgi:choline-glycine betaine transporter